VTAKRLPTIAFVLVVPLIALAAVVVTELVSPTGPDTATAAGTATITIRSFAFSPRPLRAVAGSRIRVANTDGTAHTVTAHDHAFDTGQVEGGARATITVPRRPGTYRYFCAIHEFMTGTIEVAP
jgi:plastocyanin